MTAHLSQLLEVLKTVLGLQQCQFRAVNGRPLPILKLPLVLPFTGYVIQLIVATVFPSAPRVPSPVHLPSVQFPLYR